MREAANTGRGLIYFLFKNIVYRVVVLEENSSRRCGTKGRLLVISCLVVLYFVAVVAVEEELVVVECADMMMY